MTVQNCTSVGTGDWDDGSTWSTGSAPQAAEHVIIANGHDVTIDTSSAVRSLTVQDGGKLIGNSSYTIRITHEGTASFGTNTFAVSFAADGGNGGSELGANVNLDVETSDSTMLRIQPVTGNLHNFEISHPNTLAYLTQNTTLAGNLTIGSGRLDTDSSSNYSLTVTGQCSVAGTLTCNGSTVSVGSGLTNTLGMLVQTNGTLTGGTGPHTYGTFNADASGTVNVTLTSNTTTINGSYSDGIAWAMRNGVTFNNGGGDIHFTGSGNQYLYERNNTARTLGDVTVNKSGGNFQWYDGGGAHYTMASLTITAGTFNTNETDGANPRDLTVTGDVSVTGTLTGNASAISMGSLNIASGGTYIATSGTTTVKSRTSGGYSWYAPTTGSTFTHNNGTVKFTVEDWGGANETYVQGTNFYNLEFAADTAAMEFRYDDLTDNSGLTVLNNLTITDGKVRFNQGGDSVTVHGITKMVAGQYGNTGTAPSGVHNYNGGVEIHAGTWKVTSGTCNMESIRKLGGTLA